MDRLQLSRWTGCGLAALAMTMTVAGAGCKSTRSEVPPGPTFGAGAGAGAGAGTAAAAAGGMSAAAQPPGTIGFSSAPNPVDGSASMPPGNTQYGIPAPGSNPTANYGVPASNFGPPGSNMGVPSVMPPTQAMPGVSGAGVSPPMSGLPQSGTGPSGPAAGLGVAPAARPN